LRVKRDAEHFEVPQKEEEWQVHEGAPTSDDQGSKNLHPELLAIASIHDPLVVLHSAAHQIIGFEAGKEINRSPFSLQHATRVFLLQISARNTARLL
jgi:hypothetical protein